MSKTVDLVIVAGDCSAIPAVIDAARRGVRVLVVIGSKPVPWIEPLRRALRRVGTHARRGVTVFIDTEVVCVDGIDRVEAVIVRRLGTDRLIGVNTSEIRAFGAANEAHNVEAKRRRPARPRRHRP